MFGLLDINDYFMSVNHIIPVTKQTIYLCSRRKNIPPIPSIFFSQNRTNIVKIEEVLAKQKSKIPLHLKKWKHFLDVLA